MKKVVVIGGGSGLSTLLRGIRDYPLDITAIVSVTDDGSSSGILRNDFKMLPPGDIRKCIAALSEDETVLVNLLEYRFKTSLGLKGHSFGNLLMVALKDLTGNVEFAIDQTARLLNIKGKVLPVTLDSIKLVAEFVNGKKIIGESKIAKYGYKNKIKKLTLNRRAKTNPRALEALYKADLILIGPGSLFTSILPNFLQKKLLEAVNNSSANKIFICNVSTERGETDDFSVEKHIEILNQYGVNLDGVLINTKNFNKGLGDGYLNPVNLSGNELGSCKIFKADLLNQQNPLYHDSSKLGATIWKILALQKKILQNKNGTKVYDL